MDDDVSLLYIKCNEHFIIFRAIASSIENNNMNILMNYVLIVEKEEKYKKNSRKRNISFKERLFLGKDLDYG